MIRRGLLTCSGLETRIHQSPDRKITLYRMDYALIYRFSVVILSSILWHSPSLAGADSPFTRFRANHSDFTTVYLQQMNLLAGSYLNQTDTDAKDGTGAFSLQILKAEGALPIIGLNEDLGFRLTGEIASREYTFGKDASEFGMDSYFDVVVAPELWYFFSNHFLLIGHIEAGAYSDLDGNTNGEDFRLFGGGRFVYRLESGLQLLAGAIVSEDFQDYSVIPILGLRWIHSSERLRVSMTLPLEITIANRNSECVCNRKKPKESSRCCNRRNNEVVE